MRASLVYDYANARNAIRLYDEFARGAPDEISADAGLMMGASGERLFGVSICYIGPVAEGERVFERVLKPLRAAVAPVEEQIAPIPYLEIQSAADSIFPRGRRFYRKAQFLRQITDAAVDTLLEQFAAAPSPLSIAVLQQVGGAIARVPALETAYANRDAAYDCFPIAIWQDPADDQANVRWAREFWATMRPFSTGGVYVNNLGDEGEERIRA